MSANPPTTAIDLTPLLDDAEHILATAMPQPIARAIIDLARSATTTTHQPARAPLAGDDLLTTREAAERLRVSEKQIYRLVAQGRLRRHGIGRRHTFYATDIADLLARSDPATLTTRAARLAAENHRAA